MRRTSWYVGQEVPRLSILNTQCKDVEMVEDVGAVRDTVEDSMEEEIIASGAVRWRRRWLRRKLYKLFD